MRNCAVYPVTVLLTALMGCTLPPAITALPGRAAEPSAPSLAVLPSGSPGPPGRMVVSATWQWQLSDPPIDMMVDAQVYDIDLFDNDAQVVAELHSRGRRVICYLDAGSWEEWRPDATAFPTEVLGKAYPGWEGERWIDIRRLDVLGPILARRLDLCRDKGFDGVEPDNVDGYLQLTGFDLTEADQLTFNRWLAHEAHARGLSVGLKNAPELASVLVADFDWAMTEDCFIQDWCQSMLPFLQAGKAVFAAEYTDSGVDFKAACKVLRPLGFSLILKERGLTASRWTCDR